MTLMGIEALKQDPATRVIVVLSKPPAEEVAATVLSKLEDTGKPCVAHFLGRKPSGDLGSIWFSGKHGGSRGHGRGLVERGSIPTDVVVSFRSGDGDSGGA